MAKKFDLNYMLEVASALQKEIRRGRKHEARAMYWATELEEVNPCFLWNRLRLIASEDISIANSSMVLLIDTLHKWYLEFKKRKKNEHRLFLAHAILALCRSPKSRIACELIQVVYGEKKFEGLKLRIPDYALDMHTAKGKAKKRGMKHFLEEGAKLVNESQKVKNPYKKKAEELWLKYGEA